jgi:nicotinate-nucleotide adenylyltransferase
MSEQAIRQPTEKLRVGILGGSFDPIHVGHLLIAEYAREEFQLSEVRFTPAAISPLKLDKQPADAKHRVEMVRLAIGGNAQFKLDERELQRVGPSYTVDTLAELKSENPDAELVFIMGADSLAELHAWRDPARICQLSYLAIALRGGQPAPDLEQLRRFLPQNQVAQAAEHILHLPQLEISSTEIRHRIHVGKSIRYQVPAAVEAYIAAAKLYTASEA